MPALIDQSYFKAVNPQSGVTDVFQNVGAQTRHIDLPEFKQLGLNVNLLPQQKHPLELGGVQVAPGQSYEGATGAGNFKIDIPKVIDAETIRNGFQGGITRADIDSLLNNLRSQQAQTASLMQPSERERQLQQQLANLQTSEELGVNKIRNEVIPLPLIVGQEANLRRQAEAAQAGVQRSLALEQGGRQSSLEASRFLSESTKGQFDLLLQSDQALRQREQLIQSAIDKQTDNARNALSTVISNFGGLDWKDLDTGTQAQLTRLATNAGFPIGLLQQGLQTMKERQLLDQKQKLADLQAQRETQNEFRRAQLGISAQNANTLTALRNIQLQQQTAVTPGQVVNAKTGLPAKLTEAQGEKFSGYQQFTDYYVPQIQDLLNRVTTGGATGRILKAAVDKPALQEGLNQDQNDLLATIADMNNSLVYLKSGKQINEQEYERLKQSMPDLNLTNAQNVTRVGRFQKTMQSAFDKQLRIMGLDIAGRKQSNQQQNNKNINLNDLDFKL